MSSSNVNLPEKYVIKKEIGSGGMARVFLAEDKELGKYVEISIGDNYTLLYGQLTDIQVSEGDEIEEGVVLAYVASPSPYYTKEGSHLYLKVTQNGETVDPMLLLR